MPHRVRKTSWPNLRVALLLARSRMRRTVSSSSRTIASSRLAKLSASVAWNPVGFPSCGVTMSSSGPAEAWTSGMRPAAFFRVRAGGSIGPRTTRGEAKWTNHELDDGDPKVLVDHRVQPDGRAAEERDEVRVGHVDGELD